MKQRHLTCSAGTAQHAWSRGVRGLFMSRRPATFLSAIVLVAGLAAAATPARKAGLEKFTALAYSIDGKSADGSTPRKGTVSADPNVLPLGSKIRMIGAGYFVQVTRTCGDRRAPLV